MPISEKASRHRPDRLVVREESNAAWLQNRLCHILEEKLRNPRIRTDALAILRTAQARTLHLEDQKTHIKTPIEVSLLPVVVSDETETKLDTFVQTSNLVRSAILMKMDEDPHLRAFMEAGVDPITIEIMRANPYVPAKNQWRFRADTLTDQETGTIKAIENNGGEPSGDGVISDTIRVVEQVLGLSFNDESLSLSGHHDIQMMEVLIARYQELTGNERMPTIGYFSWEGRSALTVAEARYTAKKYKEEYGTDSTQFDPRDIVDIKKVVSETGKLYYVIVCEKQDADGGEPVRTEIEIVRRLHGEPMENLDLWREFKETYGQQLCSDGEETIWDRFTKKLGEQMVNPLNSYSTDKKLDVILGNAAFLEHFGIWEKVAEIAADDSLSDTLSLTDETRTMVRDGRIRSFIAETFPQAHMLRRRADGLYKGAVQGNDLGLSDEQIEELKQNRRRWVLKRESLAGHSGKTVFIGEDPLLHELTFDDYMGLSDRELLTLTGLTKKEFAGRWQFGMGNPDGAEAEQRRLRAVIAHCFDQLPEEAKTALQDSAWSVLIDNSLTTPDSLIQEAVAQPDIPTIIFRTIDGKDVPVTQLMHYDLNPLSIGPTVHTHNVVRVTASPKTNILGGKGALGVPISESVARSIIAKYEERRATTN